MNHKFTFHAMDKKAIIASALILFFSFWVLFSCIIYLWQLYLPISYSMGFVGIITIVILLFIAKKNGKKFTKEYEVTLNNQTIVIFKDQRENRFDWNEIIRININGWFKIDNINEYKIIMIKSKNKNSWFLTGNTSLINLSTKKDLKQMDDLIDQIDNYALKNNIKKIDLKKSYHYSFAKNYYYQF